MSTTAAVMGTGSWGTAFAAALADAGTAVTMWVIISAHFARSAPWLAGFTHPREYS